MKRNTFITGKQNSGKTILTKQIIQESKTAWYNGTENLKYLRFDIDEKTDFIVIDELHSISDLTAIKTLFNNETITFRKPYHEKLTTIPTPIVIAISNSISIAEASEILKEKFDYIEL